MICETADSNWVGTIDLEMFHTPVTELDYVTVSKALLHSFATRFRVVENLLTEALANEVIDCMVTPEFATFADLVTSWNGDVKVICATWTEFSAKFPTVSQLIYADNPHIVTDGENEHILTFFNPQLVFEQLVMPGGLDLAHWSLQHQGNMELVYDDAIFTLMIDDKDHDCSLWQARSTRLQGKYVPGGEIRMRMISSPRLICVEFVIAIHPVAAGMYHLLDLRYGDNTVIGYPSWIYWMMRAAAVERGFHEFFVSEETRLLLNHVHMPDITWVRTKRAAI